MRFPPPNGVAHAQVSVNPGNWRVGYHTDWAAHLPFGELGLGDNNRGPLASIVLFGFEPDGWLSEAGGPLGKSLEAGAELVLAEASNRSLPVEVYRRQLQKRYLEALAASRLWPSS